VLGHSPDHVGGGTHRAGRIDARDPRIGPFGAAASTALVGPRPAVAAAITVAIASGLAMVPSILPSSGPQVIAPAANAQELAERAAQAIEK
jgi:hypothetical protein